MRVFHFGTGKLRIGVTQIAHFILKGLSKSPVRSLMVKDFNISITTSNGKLLVNGMSKPIRVRSEKMAPGSFS